MGKKKVLIIKDFIKFLKYSLTNWHETGSAYCLSGLLVKQVYVEFTLTNTIGLLATGCLHALSQNQSELHENVVQSSNHLKTASFPLFADKSLALAYF